MNYIEQFREIKKITITALFSDDELMQLIVLKGGNALDIIYNIAGRSSIDIDLSIAGAFDKVNLDLIRKKIFRTLELTFNSRNYIIFDFKFFERPPTITNDMADFWGGYRVEFKVIQKEKFSNLSSDIEAMRRQALEIGAMNKKTFSIDISKYEYCESKLDRDFEGLTIYVYSPEMILFEKLRAICQQMPEYGQIVKSSSQSARARDFFDIFIIINTLNIDITSEKNIEMLKAIFEAKKVPLSLIGKIMDFREYHRPDFQSVIDTAIPSIEPLKDFDFYFDYVVDKCRLLNPLG